jgi:hypothetical protein
VALGDVQDAERALEADGAVCGWRKGGLQTRALNEAIWARVKDDRRDGGGVGYRLKFAPTRILKPVVGGC